LRPVEPEVVERCIELAQAPTGSNAQGWHFVVVTDREKTGGARGALPPHCGHRLAEISDSLTQFATAVEHEG